MNKKYFIITGTVLIIASLFALSCSLTSDTADSRFDGAWVAMSGVRLEFNRGRFTRTSVAGAEETGTFAINNSDVTFYQKGFSPETHPYSLNFPELTIGPVIYYRDMDTMPDELEGQWIMYSDTGIQDIMGFTYVFESSKPVRGNPNVLEGFVELSSGNRFFRGIYWLRSHALPDTNNITMNITHMNGSDMVRFINSNFIHLVSLFDPEALQPPAGLAIEHWWLNAQEVERIFENAAANSRNLQEQTQITTGMRNYLNIMQTTSIIEYTLESDPVLVQNHRVAATGLNKLTMRERVGNTTYVETFFRLDESKLITGDDDYPGEPDPTKSYTLSINPGFVNGVYTNVNVNKGANQVFTMSFPTERPADRPEIGWSWDTTWAWPPEAGTYNVAWVVRPWNWDDHPGRTLHPGTDTVPGTEIKADPANPLSATLTVHAEELFSNLRVEVWVSLFNMQSHATVRIVTAP